MSGRPVVFVVVIAMVSLLAVVAVAADDDPVICAPPKKGQVSPCDGVQEGSGGILQPSGRSVKKAKAGQKKVVKPEVALKSTVPAGQAYVSKDRPDWVRVPAGTFQMGTKFGDVDEQPVHAVTLSAFMIARTEVTVAQYERCVKAGKCKAPMADPDCNYGQKGRRDFPVNCVNRSMAADYARFVGGRLPTEAEWEYAAGLGDGTVKGRQYVLAVEDYTEPGKPKNPDYSEINDYAWYRVNSGGKCQPVATRKPSSIGLYDMLGNVMEWVSDWMGPYSANPATNPTGPAEGSMAQVRGGGWNSHGFEARVHDRQYVETDAVGIYLGIRPVKDVPAN